MFDMIYNRIANVYDVMYGMFLKPGIKLGIEMMDLSSGQSVLEVGIGTGLTLGYYPPGVKITGIDVSDAMLEQCRKKISEGGYQNVNLLNMSGLEMNFKDNSFDRVFAPSVISVVSYPERAVAEMLRVCKPDGFVAIVSHFAGEKFHTQLIDKLADPITQKLLGFCMHTPARVVESAPDGIVLKKRSVFEPINFSTVYLMRKTQASEPKTQGNGHAHSSTKKKKRHAGANAQ